MDLNEKKDIITAWNEVEEVVTNLNGFSDEELLEHKGIIKQRLELAINVLGEHFSDDDVIETLKL